MVTQLKDIMRNKSYLFSNIEFTNLWNVVSIAGQHQGKNTFHGCFLQALVFKKAGRLRGERKGQQILVNWYC